MAEPGLSITYSDLMLEAAAFLGYGPDPDAWTTHQAAELDRYVQAGVRRFYYPQAVEGVEDGYQWSFLMPVAEIVTVADTATQDLPWDVARVLGHFHYDENEYRRSITQISEQRYRELQGRAEASDAPRFARVRHKAQAPGLSQRFEVAWWPVPDTAYTLAYRYEAYTGKLSDDNPYPLGGMKHAELVTESCLAVAEQRANDERGLHTDAYERLLKAAVQQDRRQGAGYYGHMGSFEETPVVPRHGETDRTYPITYKGSSI